DEVGGRRVAGGAGVSGADPARPVGGVVRAPAVVDHLRAVDRLQSGVGEHRLLGAGLVVGDVPDGQVEAAVGDAQAGVDHATDLRAHVQADALHVARLVLVDVGGRHVAAGQCPAGAHRGRAVRRVADDARVVGRDRAEDVDVRVPGVDGVPG